jgi:protein TonB
MKRYLRVASVAWLIVLQCAFGAGSEWVSRPQPKFPAEARKKAAEGSIRFRLLFAEDGWVKQAVIAKSSGENLLDEAARQAVLRWRLNPRAI